MKRVWKYDLTVDDAEHQLPLRVLHAAAVGVAHLVVWAEVDPEQVVTAPHRVIGTGHAVPEGGRWVATVPVFPFVWHVYRIDRP